ncbi:ABC transporter substrate-binding protein [Pelagibacterium sp.]|uniref:ABC transporter substrate-binding protein n=1 Tax=Pelagibacterium sp. TaxID=1967288 RepID=UPI003A9561DE
MNTIWKKGLLASCAVLAVAGAGVAQEFDYGSFDGYTLRVKLIGGTQYERLYTRIPEWEEMTGATVEIVSSKNHFDLDREIKQDMAAGQISWCVGSNHTSFAPQYGDLYIDLNDHIPESELSQYVEGTLAASEVDGRLVQLPRVTDVSNLYYRKSAYDDADNQAAYMEEFGVELAPPTTYDEFRQQVIFFADPPNVYGTAFAGKDEGMSGRFMEILRANGGDMFDENWNPTFNSPEGVAALQWFIDIYEAGAVPAGTVNYTWDDIGQAMAAGQLVLDLDWPGFAGFYADPEASRIADDLGFAVAPVGSAGVRGAWSGSHSFSVTEACDNKDAAVSFAVFMTNDESELLEAQAGNLPTRSATFDQAVAWFNENDMPHMAEMFQVFQGSLDEARTPPLIAQWIEVSNVLWPELQAAIVGEKDAQQALDDAAQEATYIMEDAGLI